MKVKEGFRINPYIHGTFFEYFGRVIYDGVWVGKDSSIPNINGIRKDVIDGCREAGLTVCRWPGGCCAEKYHWKDGIGPDRKPRFFFASSEKTEPLLDHSFGTDEFIEFCRLTGMEPMLVANVTTGTAEEFQDWYEYCNGDARTKYGSMRAANGHPEPYNVKLWGIGNTDENTWGAANNPIPYSASYLRYTGALGPINAQRLKYIGLGFSIRHGNHGWVEQSLDYITENGKKKGPDSLSVHHYLGGMKDRRCGKAVDYTDEEYEYLLDSLSKYQLDIDTHRFYIREHTNPAYPTTLSIDEWGIWHPEATIDTDQDEPQTLRDAIFAGMALHIFYRNCDIVEMAMETQLSNLLQSLFETRGEKFYKTPTFYVMKLFREHLGNDLLDLSFPVSGGKTDIVSSVTPDRQTIVISCVNRHLTEYAELNLPDELSGYRVALADEIANDNVRAQNTFDHPDEITAKPVPITGKKISLKPHSVSRLILKKNIK